MSAPPPIQSSGPVISPEVDWETRRHLQLLYQKLGNHTQAFQLQQQQIANLKAGSTTTNIIAGGGGSAPAPPPPPPSTGFLGQGLINNQTGATSYITQPGDNGILLVLNDAAPVAVTLTTNAAPFYLVITNMGTGTATLTPSTGTINGGASLALLQGQTVIASCDSTNWETTALAAPLQSPALTGTPTAPTAAPLTNSTQIATTAYADAAVAVEKTRAVAAEALLAPQASPTFTGTVTQPAPSVVTAATTATSATAGAATALPATPLGYLQMIVNGTTVKVPFYSV